MIPHKKYTKSWHLNDSNYVPPNYGTGGAALGLPRPGALLVLQGPPGVLYTPGAKRALLVEPAPSRGEIGDGSMCVQTADVRAGGQPPLVT